MNHKFVLSLFYASAWEKSRRDLNIKKLNANLNLYVIYKSIRNSSIQTTVSSYSNEHIYSSDLLEIR